MVLRWHAYLRTWESNDTGKTLRMQVPSPVHLEDKKQATMNKFLTESNL